MQLHQFSAQDLANLVLPETFNNPFHYTPHPLCSLAMNAVMQQIEAQPQLHDWFSQGKMLGVLVVAESSGVGFLAAYSGNYEIGSADYFVPPVFDLSQPQGFYLQKDQEITALNRQIAELSADAQHNELCKVREVETKRYEQEIQAYKQEMQAAKVRRDQARALGGLTPEELAQFTRESQFQKAELKRRKMAYQALVHQFESELKSHQEQIGALKRRRKELSEALQREIFEHFRFHNGRGEVRSLLEIFAEYSHTPLPPAGAGECAGPRLLEYAYRHRLRPLAMAEFWYGRPTTETKRTHACCYPACQEKCAPILKFMLQGLKVEAIPAPTLPPEVTAAEVVYEDADLLIVNKPSGVLSVPGKGAHPYVLQLLQNTHPDAVHYLPAHRLDMDTSGLLLVAKSAEMHVRLQQLFAQRRVEKEYQAWLQGNVTSTCGIIRLPLSPDPYHRPKQRVDRLQGKNAVTLYHVVRREAGRSLVRFVPLTGRTHQLRVHASAAEGLNAPIVGDPLYAPHLLNQKKSHAEGTSAQDFSRLQLHACRIKFLHPRTGEVVEAERRLWR
jgi:tRNA pseudouridine32 synthase/23S rRNA pseudouridine746 synthase